MCSGGGYGQDSLHPLKYKLAEECWLLTIGKIEVLVCIRGGVGVVVEKGRSRVVVGKGSRGSGR